MYFCIFKIKIEWKAYKRSRLAISAIWYVDPRKSGASVNGKELKDDEMQHIKN